jgi:hypothetical protein
MGGSVFVVGYRGLTEAMLGYIVETISGFVKRR